MQYAELAELAELRFSTRLGPFRRALEADLAAIREQAAVQGTLSSSGTRSQLFQRCADEVGNRVRSAWGDYREALESAGFRLSNDDADATLRRIEVLTRGVLQDPTLRYGQGSGRPPFDLETPFREALAAVAAEVGLFRARSEADGAVSTGGDAGDRTRDHLTQLLLRAAFDADLSRHAREAKAIMPAALILGDVDHFKVINDSKGHPVGDAVLKEVARRLLTVSAEKGTAYRYGGEEVAILLANHSAQEGLAVAERARHILESSPVEGLKVTASFGVAIIPDHASDAQEWLKRADDALYEAKKLGRNLVRLAGEQAPQQVERRGRATRKQPEPGTLSDETAEQLRTELLRNGFIDCPVDQFRLEVKDSTTLGSLGRDFYVSCPGCGFHAWLRSPQRS